jgi:hypothetical protein
MAIGMRGNQSDNVNSTEGMEANGGVRYAITCWAAVPAASPPSALSESEQVPAD